MPGDLARSVVDAAARVVAELMPVIANRVPPGPAARLGRLGVPDGDEASPVGRPAFEPGWGRPRVVVAPHGRERVAMPVSAGPPVARGGSDVARALGELGPILPERLLGALELTVDALPIPVVDGLLDPEEPWPRAVAAAVVGGGDAEAAAAVSTVDQWCPGRTGLAHRLAVALAGHPAVEPGLTVDGADEAEIAARHGATFLALAVATAAIVVRPVLGTAAAVGTGIGVAVLLLRRAPMPAGYAAALQVRRQAEYLLPAMAAGTAGVAGHRFALTEGAPPDRVDFSANGLVAVVPGGAVIRTGMAEGQVSVRLTMLAEPPEEVETTGWDEVVEVSWAAEVGSAAIAPAGRYLTLRTPPWPGEYRLRVHATGRDDGDATERYLLVVWAAPAAPQVVHKRTDQLGQRLRGEPVIASPPRPEEAYRWTRRSVIAEGATVTAVTGSTVDEVLRAFGADPSAPAALSELDPSGLAPWVAVLAVGERRVLAVESNGWQGAQEAVLRGLSVRGRAASMYWSADALSRLSFAEAGTVTAAFEPGLERMPEAVAELLAGLDFQDYRDKREKGLVAVERFTGLRLREEDVAAIQAAGVGYPIRPESR